MENTAEFYYEKLKKDEKPGVVLATFYCTLYDIPVTKSEIIMFNRLVKTYSRFIVFFTILDITGSYKDKPEEPYRLFGAICKRRFETTHLDSTVQARESLERYIDNIDEELKLLKKQNKHVVIPPLEGTD